MTTYRTVAAVDSTPAEKAAATAVCTGANDQNVINSLLGNDVELGFFSGHYNCQGIILANNFTNLKLKSDLSAHLVRNYAGHLLRAYGSHGIVIDAIDFSQVDFADNPLVAVRYSTDFELINNVLHDCYSVFTVMMNPSPPYTKSERVRIDHCELYASHGSGINISNGVDYAYITNNHLHDFIRDPAHWSNTTLYAIDTSRPDEVANGYLAEHVFIEDNLIERHEAHEALGCHGANYWYARRNRILQCANCNVLYFHHNTHNGYTKVLHDLVIEDNEVDGCKNGTIISCEYPDTSIQNVRIRNNKYRNYGQNGGRAAISVSIEGGATNGSIEDVRVEHNDIGPGNWGLYAVRSAAGLPMTVETWQNIDQSTYRVIGNSKLSQPFPATYTNFDTTVTEVAPPTPVQHNVTVAVSGNGSTNPVAGSYPINEGEPFEVRADAAAGYQFDHWEGDIASVQNPLSFTVTADTSITAVFVPAGTPPIAKAGIGFLAVLGAIIALRKKK